MPTESEQWRGPWNHDDQAAINQAEDAEEGSIGLEWGQIGDGIVSRVQVDDGRGGQNQRVFKARLPFGFQLSARKKTDWMLLPYVDPVVATSKKIEQFKGELARLLALKIEDLDAMIRNDNERLKLLVGSQKQLIESYKVIENDLNLTTLSLFSGPALIESRSRNRFFHRRIGVCYGVNRWSCHRFNFCECGLRHGCGWLGTGDANLKDANCRASFLKYFGSHLGDVLTLTLPHHGSANSFDPELLKKISARYCVATANQHRTWHHPASSVVQAVFEAGMELHVATSGTKSRFAEESIFSLTP